jgi:hypothetical protein
MTQHRASFATRFHPASAAARVSTHQARAIEPAEDHRRAGVGNPVTDSGVEE